MAINKKLIHFKKYETFKKEFDEGNILDTSICWIEDRQMIFTHQWGLQGIPDGGLPDQILTIDDDGNLIWSDPSYYTKEELDKVLYDDPFNGYEYVDMGEAGIWATCNVGASKPEETGVYFAWGETTVYTNTSDKSGGFVWKTTPYWKSGTTESNTKWSKYTVTDEYSSDGKADNKLVLEPEDDAAHVIMRGAWRMPTKEEFQNLYNACNTSWVTSYNGKNVAGRLFTLKTDSSKQLFFPATGYAISTSAIKVGSEGYYWSSSLNTLNSYHAHHFSFASLGVNPQGNGSRCNGENIRGFIPADIVKEINFYTKKEVDNKLSWKVLNPISILNITSWENIQKIIIEGKEYFPGTNKIIFKTSGNIICTVIPKEGYGVVGGETQTINIIAGLTYKLSLLAKLVEIRLNFSEGIEKITFGGIDYFETTTVKVPYSTTSISYTTTASDGYGIRSYSSGSITPTNYTSGHDISPLAARVEIRLIIAENIEKITFNNIDYFTSTSFYVPYSNSGLSYICTAKEGYGIRSSASGTIYPTNYTNGYTVEPIAERIEYRIILNNNVAKITFDGEDYIESTTVYRPYASSGNYEWTAVAEDGFGMITSSGTVGKTDYTNGYTISPEAGLPTLNIQINEGVEKIVLNGEDEYTESLTITLPFGSTVNYEVFYQEGYEAKPINWEVLTGTWNESEESEAVDNIRFTCVSPGTNGMTKIRCTFYGLNSITFKYRSDAESTYDYLIMSKLDTDLLNITSWNASSVYNNPSVQGYTRGSQGTWKEYTFSNLEGNEHFVEFMFGKDSSQDTQPDNAQVYISNIE